MDGFGFTGVLDKLGIERRLLSAGENKGFMDPFSPVNPEQKEQANHDTPVLPGDVIEVPERFF